MAVAHGHRQPGPVTLEFAPVDHDKIISRTLHLGKFHASYRSPISFIYLLRTRPGLSRSPYRPGARHRTSVSSPPPARAPRIEPGIRPPPRPEPGILVPDKPVGLRLHLLPGFLQGRFPPEKLPDL